MVGHVVVGTDHECRSLQSLELAELEDWAPPSSQPSASGTPRRSARAGSGATAAYSSRSVGVRTRCVEPALECGAELGDRALEVDLSADHHESLDEVRPPQGDEDSDDPTVAPPHQVDRAPGRSPR